MKDVKHIYEVRPRKDHRGVDLISDIFHSVGCGMTHPIMHLHPANPKYAIKPRSFKNRAYRFLQTTQEELATIRFNLLHG